METGISKEIRFKLEEYYEAFHSKEWTKFSKCISDDFRYFTDNAFVLDKKSYIDFLNQDTWQGIEYKISDLKVYASGSRDLGLLVYKTSFKGLVNNTERTFTAIETTIFIKENNIWKILHTHISNKA